MPIIYSLIMPCLSPSLILWAKRKLTKVIVSSMRCGPLLT